MDVKIFLGIILWCGVARALKYQYGDMIIIEPDEVNTPLIRTKRQGLFLVNLYENLNVIPVAQPQAVSLQPNCRTTSGQQGICEPLSDCYPVLYTAASEAGFRNLSNKVLAEDLLVSSGPCNNGHKDLVDNMVCCPTRFASQVPVVDQAPNVQGPSVRVADCGNLKVVGGSQAAPGSFPWMAALMSRGRQFCGGSLIDSRHIMTAAHCVQHMTTTDIANFRIYLGAHNVKAPSEPGRQTYKVSRVLYNKGFSHRTLHDDIAIVRLAMEVPEFTSKVQAICLSTGSPPYDDGNSKAKLSGWGKQGQHQVQSPTLLNVELPVMTNAACSAKYGSHAPAGITSGMVCAGGGGKDACQGDSGGPLMRPSPTYSSRTEQIGIVSWGIGCGTYPGVYTRVDKYRNWLDRARQTA